MAKAPEPETPPTPAEQPEVAVKKRGIPLKLIIIVGVILVQAVGSYFLQKALVFRDQAAADAAVEKPKEPEKPEGEEKIVMLDEIVVNPAETGGRRYLAVTIGLQTHALDAEKRIEERRAVIRDALITLLSSKPLAQLSDIAYRDTLRAEIKEAMAKQMKDIPIESIVFSGYVLQ